MQKSSNVMCWAASPSVLSNKVQIAFLDNSQRLYFGASSPLFWHLQDFSTISQGVAAASSVSHVAVAPLLSCGQLITAAWHKTHRYHCTSLIILSQTLDLKRWYVVKHREIYLLQMGLNVTDVHLYVKIHCTPASSWQTQGQEWIHLVSRESSQA